MPIRICILLLMQSAPLAGTATVQMAIFVLNFSKMQSAPLAGTATTPASEYFTVFDLMQSAPLAGTATPIQINLTSLVLDAIRTPRGDGNSQYLNTLLFSTSMMQSAPLAGTATSQLILMCFLCSRCNPHPSRGRQRDFVLHLGDEFQGCNPHPSRGRQPAS